jgi:hypothetical protein
MEMRDFILHIDILSVEVKIDGNDYRFGVRWKHLINLTVKLGFYNLMLIS